MKVVTSNLFSVEGLVLVALVTLGSTHTGGEERTVFGVSVRPDPNLLVVVFQTKRRYAAG